VRVTDFRIIIIIIIIIIKGTATPGLHLELYANAIFLPAA